LKASAAFWKLYRRDANVAFSAFPSAEHVGLITRQTTVFHAAEFRR